MMETTKAADVRSEIARANEKFMECYRMGDAAGVAALYTQNGMILPPNRETVEGLQQIQEFWKLVMGMGIKSIDLKPGEVEVCGDTAYEMSRATLADEEGNVLDQAKYVVIWKKESGGWKLHRDIFNSNLPAQQ
jgi:uncharacterized protein (TIGR02246 family)